MRVLAVSGTALTGLVTAVATGGWYGLAGLCLVLAGGLGAGVWVIGNRAHTLNAVALITAARSRSTPELGPETETEADDPDAEAA